MLGQQLRCWPNIFVVNKCVCKIVCPPRALNIGRAIHECGTFPTTVLQDHFNMSSALSLSINDKKNKCDDFYFLSVHFKKVYMVSDESELHITFYNGSRHMHDMPQKLTLIESYLVRPITRVSMPSLPDYRAGFKLRDPPLTAIDTPLKLNSLCTLALSYTMISLIICPGALFVYRCDNESWKLGDLSSHYYYFVFSNIPYINKDLIGNI